MSETLATTCIHCGTEQTHRVCAKCFAVRPELRAYLRECFPPAPDIFESVTDEVTDKVLRIVAGNGSRSEVDDE